MVTEHDTRKKADAERLADIFTILQRCFVINLSKELARGRVSFAQYSLLGFLSQNETPLSMTEIANRMRHTTAAATGLVDRLEKLAYVRRATAKSDRRKILVQITKKGADLVSRVRNEMANNVARLMDLLEEDEQKAWLRIYEKIIAVMNPPLEELGIAYSVFDE